MTIGIMLFEGLSEPFTLVNSAAELWSENITTFYHLKVEDRHKENLLIDFFKANILDYRLLKFFYMYFFLLVNLIIIFLFRHNYIQKLFHKIF